MPLAGWGRPPVGDGGSAGGWRPIARSTLRLRVGPRSYRSTGATTTTLGSPHGARPLRSFESRGDPQMPMRERVPPGKRRPLSRICYMDSMEAVPDMSLYKVALIVLGAAGVVIPIFHRLQISSVLGFRLGGMAVGPFGFGALTTHFAWLAAVTIDAPQAIQPVADLGVTLLLFMIG